MKRQKLRPIELRVWQLLCDDPTLSADEIAEEIYYAPDSVRVAITALVAAGYVGRRPRNAPLSYAREILIDYYTVHAIDI
jgi:DNA-binding MarR family transcriptional regulator